VTGTREPETAYRFTPTLATWATAHDAQVDPRSLVFDVEDEICGWGRLVRTPDGDWFDPPLPIRLIRYGPEGPPPPRRSNHGIPVERADFDAVERRYERDGAIEGYGKIYGVWFGNRISLYRQTNERPEISYPPWSDPPCEPPPGGWPRNMNGPHLENLDFDLGDLVDSGAAITSVVFRPSDDQAVLVVAASDIPAVEALLRPQLPDRLCVVPSRWTRTQLDEAHEHLNAMWADWGIYECGTSCDEQAQATVTAKLMRVTDEIADWAATQPDGLIALQACLEPVRVDGR